VADIIAAAKARPETISYGTGGVGSPGHLCGILFDHIAGTRTVPVPYRGGGPQMLALVAGEHDFGFSPMGTVLTHVQAGTIRALGVATKTRARELPNVPSMIEAGLPNFEVLNWDGFVLPAGTPAPIRARLGEVSARGGRRLCRPQSCTKSGWSGLRRQQVTITLILGERLRARCQLQDARHR